MMRCRPPAANAAMIVAALWLILSGLLDALTGLIALSLFSIAPLIAATVADERRTAVFGAAAVALAIGAGWWDGIRGHANYWAWVTVGCAVSAMAVLLAGVRPRPSARLGRPAPGGGAPPAAPSPPPPPRVSAGTPPSPPPPPPPRRSRPAGP